MPYGHEEYAQCPRCGKKVYGKEEIIRLFGYRIMEKGNVIPQSHCKECRVEEAKENK